MDLFQILRKFNQPFFIIIIFIISSLFLTSFIIIIERITFFRKILINEKKIYKDFKNALIKNDVFFVFNLSERVFSPLMNLVKAGINHRSYSAIHIKSAINQATALELPKFEKNITIISILVIFLPFFGLIVLFISNIEILSLLESKDIYFIDFISLKNFKVIFTFIYVLFCTLLITFSYYYIIKKKNDIIFIFEKWAGKLVFSLINKKE